MRRWCRDAVPEASDGRSDGPLEPSQAIHAEAWPQEEAQSQPGHDGWTEAAYQPRLAPDRRPVAQPVGGAVAGAHSSESEDTNQ